MTARFLTMKVASRLMARGERSFPGDWAIDLEPLPGFAAVLGAQHEPAIADDQTEAVFAKRDAVQTEARNLKIGLPPVTVIRIGLKQRASFADGRNTAVESRGGKQMVGCVCAVRVFALANDFPARCRRGF